MEKHLKKEDLKALTQELVLSIKEFSDTLPEDEVYELRRLIRNSICTLPNQVEEASNLTTKLSIIRGMIKVNSNLDECKNYLNMAEKLKFAKTEEMMTKVVQFTNLVNTTLTGSI